MDKSQISPINLNNFPPIQKLETNKDEEWAESGGLESPLVNFVTPLFKFLRIIFMTHSTFEFDSQSKNFQHVPGSKLRKILCTISHILVIGLSLGEGKVLETSLGENTVVGLFKIMGFAYLALIIAFQWALMSNGDQIRDILNFTQSMTCCISKLGCKIPRKKIIKPLSTIILIVYIIQAILFSLVNMDGTHGMALLQGPRGFFEIGANAAVQKFWILTSKNSSQILNYKFTNGNQNSAVIILIGLSHFILHVRMTLVWVMAFLMLTMWGFLFWKVLHIFFAVVSNCSVRNTLEDIRRFNNITATIDQFNKAFGWTILTALVAGVLHFSVNLVDLFEPFEVWTQKAIVVIGLMTLATMLVAAAQVNESGGSITDVMKARYQEMGVWHENHGRCDETTQGMMLVIHEVQSLKIGFRGLGFFTITYSFIGTVLSLISTYSLVVMQLQT